MKLKFYVVVVLILSTLSINAQDEGVISKKARIGNDKSLFLNFGPSFTLGKNIGDYKTGFNIELGFTKRLNRLLSVGPSISYIGFNYDPQVTSVQGGGAYVGYGDPNDWATKYALPDLQYAFGYVLNLKGGDIGIASLALNLKLNLVPVKDNSIISAYLFAKPFISYASRSEVIGSDTRYAYEIYEDRNNTETIDDDVLYQGESGQVYADGYTSTWDGTKFDALKANSKVTGGIFLGPGVEIFPARKFSFYLQASFGYTLPVSFVSTKSYQPTVADYVKKEFPMVTKGFPSVNIQLGGAFNF